MYHLIAQRFIAAFYPDCEFLATTVMGKAADVEFKASGKVITMPGWRTVFGKDAEKSEGDNSDDKLLPPFTKGESGPHEPSILKKTTQPPKYYTEGTLLRAMETAGKTVDDETLREAMKENGIGRPSTRAAIIETLFKRHYIYRQRKNIMVTQAGIDLINTITEELLKSAKLTGLWENKLRQIERGNYSAPAFINELKMLIQEIVTNVLSDNSMRKIAIEDDEADKKKANKAGKADDSDKEKKKTPTKRRPAIKKLEEIVCPICGNGHILKGNSAYGCSKFREGCTLRLPFTDFADTLTPAKLAAEIKKKFKTATKKA
jgi:DNA topoisomerase-3